MSASILPCRMAVLLPVHSRPVGHGPLPQPDTLRLPSARSDAHPADPRGVGDPAAESPRQGVRTPPTEGHHGRIPNRFLLQITTALSPTQYALGSAAPGRGAQLPREGVRPGPYARPLLAAGVGPHASASHKPFRRDPEGPQHGKMALDNGLVAPSRMQRQRRHRPGPVLSEIYLSRPGGRGSSRLPPQARSWQRSILSRHTVSSP